MIHPDTIAFDIDSVVADTMRLFVHIARKDYSIDITYDDITDYELEKCLDIDYETIREIIDKIIDSDYSRKLLPMKGASGVLSNLLMATDILFVTARTDIGRLEEWFFSVLLPKASSDSVELIAAGSSNAKTDILLSKKKKYFIDDRLETCFILNNAGIIPIVFNQPWNAREHPFLKVSSWKEIELMIQY